MITLDELRTCYQAILGRLPESEAVETERLQWTPSLDALIRELLASNEFQNRVPKGLYRAYEHPALPVEVDGTPAQMAQLFDRLRQQWQAMGETEPYWSVITHDEFRTKNLDDAARHRFFDSGGEHGALLDLFATRCGVTFRGDICLEMGCGVGRVTRHLAQRFKKVVAVDISEGNLREAKFMAEQEKLSNIEFVLLSSPSDVETLAPFDVLYSTMVFQHNPPPVQKYLIDVLLSKVRRKGAFFIQVQTFAPGYRFEIASHLAAPPETMDMHCLPMHVVMGLIARHGLPVFEVTPDYFTGQFGSHTFFGGGAPKRPLLRRLFG